MYKKVVRNLLAGTLVVAMLGTSVVGSTPVITDDVLDNVPDVV